MKKLIVILGCFFFISGLLAQHDLYGKWARKTGFIASEYPSSMGVSKMLTDSQGNVYICGSAYGMVSFSDNTCILTKLPGYHAQGGYASSTNDRIDGYVTKYNASGKWVWTVRVSTEVLDQCTDMCLSPDGSRLVFRASFGYVTNGNPTGTAQVIYGNGTVEALPMSPLGGWGNMAVIGLNTLDGSKAFFLNFGATSGATVASMGNVYTVDSSFFVHYFYKPGGTGAYTLRILQYDFNGVVQTSAAETALANSGPIYFNSTSGNRTGAYSYTSMSVVRTTPNGSGAGGQDWFNDQNIYRINNSTGLVSVYSRVAITSGNTNANAHRYGIMPRSIEINNANTHLFLAGNVDYTFNYTASAGLGTVTNAGSTDGIIVCYDPSKSDVTAGHIRWSVNLRASGTQIITGAVYDQDANMLRVCGYIDENTVNFNPRGTAMSYSAPRGTAGFYAVYDNNGICQYVHIMDALSNGNESVQGIVQPSSDQIVLFGTFTGSPFPVDPAGGVNPLRTINQANFIAKYSLVEAEADTPFDASFSAADKVVPSYSDASHDVQPCLALGTVNTPVTFTSNYVPRDYKGGTENESYDGLQTIQIGTGNPANGITVKVQAINSKESKAYLMGWIDFNENGIFDPGEASALVTVPANTNALTNYNLVWTLPTGVNLRFSTFMRIRLTSEEMDSNWATDAAADGEVEDYRLVFNFSVPVNPHVRITGKE